MLPSSNSHIRSFIEYLQFVKRYSPHTILSYQTDLDQFFAFLASQYDDPELAGITSAFVRSWLAEMRSEEMTAKSLNRKLSSLKSFFKYQLKMGMIKQSPMAMIISPKVGKRLPSFVAENDMETLHRSVDFPDTLKGQTDRLLIELFYATGMRRSELINLRESMIDSSYCQVKVLGKGSKERIIPVSQILMQNLQAYMQNKRKLLEDYSGVTFFVNEKGKPLYPEYVYKVVKDNLNKITTVKKKSPHVLRHTFATHLSNNGADLNAIKELLGHSSLAATQIYTHNTIGKLKDIFSKAHPKA